MITAERPDDDLGQGRGRGKDHALGIPGHEVGIVAGGRARLAEERASDQSAVIIKWVIVAPDRPAIRQAVTPPQTPPDCQAMGEPQDHEANDCAKGTSGPVRLPGSSPGCEPGGFRGGTRVLGDILDKGNRVEIAHGQSTGRLMPLHRASRLPSRCGNAARRIRTCNQGIQGPSRFREAWTISSSAPVESLRPRSR